MNKKQGYERGNAGDRFKHKYLEKFVDLLIPTIKKDFLFLDLTAGYWDMEPGSQIYAGGSKRVIDKLEQNNISYQAVLFESQDNIYKDLEEKLQGRQNIVVCGDWKASKDVFKDVSPNSLVFYDPTKIKDYNGFFGHFENILQKEANMFLWAGEEAYPEHQEIINQIYDILNNSILNYRDFLRRQQLPFGKTRTEHNIVVSRINLNSL